MRCDQLSSITVACLVLLNCSCLYCSASNADNNLLTKNISIGRLFEKYNLTGSITSKGFLELINRLQHLIKCSSDQPPYSKHVSQEQNHNFEHFKSSKQEMHEKGHLDEKTLKMPKELRTSSKMVVPHTIKPDNGASNRSISTGSHNDHEGHLHYEDTSSSTKSECELFRHVLHEAGLTTEETLTPEIFYQLCPSIISGMLFPPCGRKYDMWQTDNLGHTHHHDDHNHDRERSKSLTRDAWFGAIISMVFIGIISLCCIMVIPILKKSRYYSAINNFLLSLAVGSLSGDALIHLIPHAITMPIVEGSNLHLIHALYGFTSFLGILVFLIMERLHNLIGHKHSHGHAHSPEVMVQEPDDLIKEVGMISSEMNEFGVKHLDIIGEKLSQHSKHSSFVHVDPTSPIEPRSCFESCPPHIEITAEDSNGKDSLLCKKKVAASGPESERLVTCLPEKTEASIGKCIAPIPPPPLFQSSPPKMLVRQDSQNFNMVLQEYHVGHHGHSHHGHSHVTGKKESLRTMILLGDGMHTFMDGMAIGAAFGTNLTGGIATAIAVLCHELPHKLGDFAILFEMGMTKSQALKMAGFLWLLSITGLVLGVFIGSITSVSPWIYCFTAGVFLYLALVDLLSEISISGGEMCTAGKQMAIQLAGMLTGAAIMLVIAIYEHDLEHILENTF